MADNLNECRQKWHQCRIMKQFHYTENQVPTYLFDLTKESQHTQERSKVAVERPCPPIPNRMNDHVQANVCAKMSIDQKRARTLTYPT